MELKFTFHFNSQVMHFLNETYKFKIFFLLLLLSFNSGKSAIIPDSLLKSTAIVKSFEPNKIVHSSPNYSIIFDQSGLLFLGQEDKISVFNGFSWEQVHVKGEILLTINSNQTVFFAGGNALGYLSPDSTQIFKIHLLNQLLPESAKNTKTFKEIKSIGTNVYFRSDSILLSFNSKEFKILENSFIRGKIFTCRDYLISVKPGNQINAFQGNSIKESIVFPGPPIRFILEHEYGYLIINEENDIYITDNSFAILQKYSLPGFKGIKNALFLNSDEYIFSNELNSIFLVGKDGQIKQRLINSSDLPDSEIIEMIQEASGNIWILQEKSISRLEYPSSISVIATLPNEYGSIRDTKIFDDKIYVATTRGVFYYKSSEENFSNTPISEFCYGLIPTSHGLLSLTNDKIFLINSKKCIPVFQGRILDQSWNLMSHKLFVSETDKISILSFEDKALVNTFFIQPPVKPIKIVSVDSSLWITNGEKLYFYENAATSGQKPIKQEVNLTSGIIELFKWQNKLHILTNDKIFSYSNGEFSFERSLSNDLCGGEFISLSEDAENNVWVLSRDQEKNSILWFGNNSEKSFSKIILPSTLSLSNLSIDYVSSYNIILSAGKLIYLLDRKLYTSQTRKFETIIKEIYTGDHILFQGISYNLFRVPLRTQLNSIKYNQNDIRIELSSTNYLDNKVNYQYYLKGKDKIWSEWSNNPFIYLKNLKEGEYDLKIQCKDYMNVTSGVTTLLFRIEPPFYRTWWAYLLYFLTGGIILFIFYKTYLLNLHKARDTVPLIEVNNNSFNIPVINGNSDASVKTKSFNFYSNIDEDKIKEKTRWDKYDMVTVLFSDIQGFTKIAESMNPEMLIDELDRFFFHFDSVVEKYNTEKIKTIGDAYMAAGGIPKKSITNPIEVVLAALEMQNYMKQLKKTKIDIWDLRIGIHSGPVIAGIIGHKKRSFDIWGDTVNTASRMESTGEAGKVNISSETYKLVKDYFICEYRGKLPVKYKGNIDMYFVKGLRPELSVNLVGLPNRKFFLKLQLLRLKDLEELIFSKLEANLHKNLFFHTFEYARHLYEYSELLSKAADLDQEETLLIRTAALFLNLGYTNGYENQENRSAEFTREILPEFNYSEKQISIISNLILSTKWPPEPQNILEMIINDIKMEYIGRSDFIILYKLLFLEQNQFIKSIDILEFKRKIIDAIKNYPFFTDSARRLREISSEAQLQKIKDDDWK